MFKQAIAPSAAILDSDFIALLLVKDLHILWANKPMHALYGYEPGELIGQPVRNLFFEQASFETVRIEVDVAIAEKRTYRCEIPQKRKDGSTGWFEINVSRLEGEPDVLIAAIVDRTEQHWALDQLEIQAMILRVMQDGVVMVTPDKVIRYTNAAFDEMLGYARGELLGRDITIVHAEPEDLARELSREVIDAINTQGGWQGAFHHRRKDGSTFWSEVKISSQDSTPWGLVWVGVQRDITQRKRLQDQLEVSESRYRSVVQDQTELISRFLPDGTLLFVNEVYCLYFGKTVDELIGQKWQPVAYPGDIPMIEAKLRELSPKEPVLIIENRIVLADGTLRWMQFVNRGYFSASGELEEIQSVGRDITLLKQTEMDLREGEERLDLAMKGSGLAFWDWDILRDEVITDRRINEILGYSAEELIKQETWLQLLDPKDRARVEQAFRATLQGDSPIFDLAHRFRHKEGHWVTVEVRGKVLRRDASGAPLRMVGTLLDISQRKRLNEEGIDLLKRIETLILDSTTRTTATPEDRKAVESLTKRERQILTMIAEGVTSAKIGERLHLATNTVISHRRNLMNKLNLHSTAEVTRFALDNGLLPTL